MRNLQNLLLLFALLTLVNNSFGQQMTAQPIKKGETVPDLPLTLHLGDSITNVHLTDYKGKLILLDFWGVSCPDCIEAMPHMLALQEQFKDKIQVIVVAVDQEPAIKNLFARMKGHTPEKILFAGSHLPFVMGDTVLYKMFPHNGIPKHVWIDGSQVFRNITYGNTTTPENVEAFLEGKKVKLADAYLTTIDTEKPLTWLGGSADAQESVPDYSFFMHRLDNANTSGSREVERDSATNKVVGLAITNKRVIDIYKEVFALKNGVRSMSSNNIVLDVPDKEKYVFPADESIFFDWVDSNTYCYAIKVPLSQSGEIAEQMHQDLDRFFHLQSSMEIRSVKCLVLKRISNHDKLAVEEKGRKVGINVDKNNKLWFTIKNGEMYQLFGGVTNVVYFSNEFTPVFDESNYTGKVNITLPFTESAHGVTVDELRETLRKYGLDLVEEYRTLDMLVIKEAPPANPKEMAQK